MKKLTDSLSIEEWKQIAYSIQRLKITSYNASVDYEGNLKLLKKSFGQIGICEEDGKKHPKNKEEVGLQSLLTSIYETYVGMYYKLAFIYEQIYALSDIGVKNIIYLPFNENEQLCSFAENYKEANDNNCFKQKIRKIVTDGTFSFRPVYDSSVLVNYTLNGDENFIIIEEGNVQNFTSEIEPTDITAILRTFDGEYPSKLELEHFDFTKIDIPSQQYLINGSINYCTYNYEKFDIENLSCKKMLTRTSNDKFYYKQYKK